MTPPSNDASDDATDDATGGAGGVRAATAADVAAICALANWAAVETTANFAYEPEPLEWWQEAFATTADAYPWLAVDATPQRPAAVGTGLAGFAKAAPFGRRAAWAWTAETTVYVDPAWHAAGVGARLYRALLTTLAAQGFRAALASVTSPNPASEALHRACGFRRVGVLPAAGFKSGMWLDVAYWYCPLGEADRSAPSPLAPVPPVLPA